MWRKQTHSSLASVLHAVTSLVTQLAGGRGRQNPALPPALVASQPTWLHRSHFLDHQVLPIRRLIGSTWWYKKLMNKSPKQQQNEPFDSAEEICHISHACNPDTEFCCSSYKCTFLTRVAPLFLRLNDAMLPNRRLNWKEKKIKYFNHVWFYLIFQVFEILIGLQWKWCISTDLMRQQTKMCISFMEAFCNFASCSEKAFPQHKLINDSLCCPDLCLQKYFQLCFPLLHIALAFWRTKEASSWHLHFSS